MASRPRVLVLGTTFGGGNWTPLSAVTMGLHQAGHAVFCFGDAAIAREFGPANIPVEAVPSEVALGTFMARWRGGQHAGPAPFRAWADACLPMVRALVRDFRPQHLLSEIFTAELARLTKLAIDRVLGDPSYRERAARIASHPRARDAVATARARIEEFLDKVEPRSIGA